MNDRSSPGPPTRRTHLRVTGLVDNPQTFSEADLRALACAHDTTVSLESVLGACQPRPPASYVTVASSDRGYRASIPLPDAAGGKLQIGQNLPGGPIRLIIENGRTLCWNVKSVRELRLTDGPEPDSVPENPPH